ncbi:MAG TPA: PBP1A family penicillin-binding protein [Longimicrobiales bacterium]|nr:PBP1A family penicillin-binding protein [Longimicrobiales bacterium]
MDHITAPNPPSPAGGRRTLRVPEALRRSWARVRSAARKGGGGWRMPGWLRRFALHVPPAALLVACAVVLLADFTLWERCGLRGCPDVRQLSAYQPGGASVLLDRRGRKFADLRPVDREVVRIGTLPTYVPAAFVAVEDKRFFEHNGVDWRRVVGAAIANVRSGGVAEGFSTIPMQLARNIWSDRLPGQEKTLRRKLLEIRVAREIERRFTKQEILELYLNNIYFGGGSYGIEAASRNYFGKPARELSLPQAATLAALPKAPSTYDPRRHPARALERRNLVLSLMSDGGFIPAGLAQRARAMPVRVAAEPPARGGERDLARYFVELVRRQVEDQLGDEVYRTPLRIRTTLDVDAQRVAQEELERQLRFIERGGIGRFPGPRYASARASGERGTDYLQGAIVMLDARTGDILAMVGGRDFRDSRFNRATDARRQMGSSFKPFVYATALSHGYAPSQPVYDSPIRLGDRRRPWEPQNYDHDFRGRMSLREALVGSINVPTVRLAEAVGERDVAGFAHEAGIREDIPVTPAMALGVADATPLEVAAAYTTFATLGTRAEPRLVSSVVDTAGNVRFETPVRREAVLDPGVAYILTDILRDAVNRGTGTAVRAVGFDGVAAGKTGTTSDAADAWFVGYTPDVVGAVWIGFDRRRSIGPRVTGGGAAAPIWGRIMRRVGRSPGSGWGRPDNVVALAIDPETGRTLESGCVPRYDEPRRELFLAGEQPDPVCPRTPDEILGGPGGFIGHVWRALSGIFGGRRDDVEMEAPPQRYDPGDDGSVLGAPRLPSSAHERQSAAGGNDDPHERHRLAQRLP